MWRSSMLVDTLVSVIWAVAAGRVWVRRARNRELNLKSCGMARNWWQMAALGSVMKVDCWLIDLVNNKWIEMSFLHTAWSSATGSAQRHQLSGALCWICSLHIVLAVALSRLIKFLTTVPGVKLHLPPKVVILICVFTFDASNFWHMLQITSCY